MMHHDYIAVTDELSAALGKLRQDIPEVTRSFTALAQTANTEGQLDKKTKELIAMGIAVAVRCQGCVGFHAQALVKLGASRAELVETLGVAIYMGGGPSLMTAAEALIAFEQFSQKT